MLNLKTTSLLLALSLLTACSSLQQMADVKKPKATITSASIGDISFKEITLNTKVKLENPNGFAVNASAMDLELSVMDQQVARIKKNDTLELPAKGSNEVVLPITLRYSDLFHSVKGLFKETEAPFAINGDVKIAVPVLGDIKVPVKFADKLPIPQLPDISLKDVSVDSFSLSKIKLTMDVEVDNPNAFAVKLQSLGMKLFANDKALSSGNVREMNIAKGGKQIVSVPVEVSVKDIGMSAFNMLTEKGSTVFKMDGVANILPEIGNWKAEAWNFSAEKEVKR